MIKQVGPETKTHFLNVDLEISSSLDLQPLIDAFGKKVVVLYAAKRGRTHYAHFEISAPTKDADSTIGRFCKLIRALPPSRRALWRRASKRDFNIGVQIMAEPTSCELTLTSDTIRAAAAVDARIVFTTYSPKLLKLN